MFEQDVRCIDCGFLGLAVSDPLRPVAQPITVEPASLGERTHVFMVKGGLFNRRESPYSCVRGIDLGMEYATRMYSSTPEEREESVYPAGHRWSKVLAKQRRCEYFERLMPGAGFDRHFDANARRIERGQQEIWQWMRMLVALIVGFAGGVITHWL